MHLRGVRRSRLIEQGERRPALADRLVKLVVYFAIDVLESVLLTNRFHLVARELDTIVWA